MNISASHCISCGEVGLRSIIDFGETPLADALLREDQLSQPEILAPLELAFCPACALVQITTSVSPDILFCRDYPYYSSVSPSLMRHFQSSAEAIIRSRNLNAESLVVEAASNDGYMLHTFMQAGIPVLGVDPAVGPAAVAQERGIPTLTTFFTRDLAVRLREEGKSADVFLANNVLAHVPDLNGFVAGIRTILKNTGIAIIEAPYVADLVDHNEFDTIYHQHLCYFSVTALDKLFRRHGLFLNAVERTSIHGGSLRLFVAPVESVSSSVRGLLQTEHERRIDTYDYYLNFASRIEEVRVVLLNLLTSLKAQNKRIAGYGAAAKATTMMAFVGITKEHLEFVADLNPVKHGRFMGRNHIPIVSPSAIHEQMPDFVLIFAWNFAKEIMSQLGEYRKNGGAFIIPLPELRVLEGILAPEETEDFTRLSR